MKQRLADLLQPLLDQFHFPPARYTPFVQQVPKTRAEKIGIQLGGVYYLKTARGLLVVQVIERRQHKVVVKEVEDMRLFHANPAHLYEYTSSGDKQ